MSTIEYLFQTAADFLWKDWMLVLLLGLGIYYTFLTGFVQIRLFPFILKSFVKEIKGKKTNRRKTVNVPPIRHSAPLSQAA